MALPENGAQWPPPQLKDAYQALAMYDAWLTGDPSTMQKVFAEAALTPRGGLLGRLGLPFWGSPNLTTAQQPPKKIHVPIAGSISRMSADQVFGEMFSAEFTNDHDSDDQANDAVGQVGGQTEADSVYFKATARLKELLDDQAHTAFLAAGELASAHGGSYLKIAWDDEVNPDGPFLTVMGADAAVPVFRYGRLLSVAFWTQLTDRAGARYILFEDHQPGTIEFALYESSAQGMVGTRVPLSSHPDALTFADLVNEDSKVETGSDLLTAVYLPNRRPNPKFRKDPIAQHFGRSDYDGAEAMMDALDGWYTSLDRDFRLGRARIMVPKGLLQLSNPGDGATFNADQEVFTEMGETVGSLNTGATGSADSFIKESQPAIRYQEHLSSIEHLYERIYAACGFSAQSFGESNENAITATEVASREKLTLQSRSAKIMVARPVVVNLLAALMDVDKRWFNGPGRSGLMPNIEWPDAVGENPEVLARTLQSLNLAEATSMFTRVQMLHGDWDDVQILEEVERIREDMHGGLPDPSERVLWNALGGPTAGQVASDASAGDAAAATDDPLSDTQPETGAQTPPAAAGETPTK